MAKDYAKAFYNSKAWIACKNGYMQSQHYICERCGDIATVCHHKIHLTPENIHDPYITLNWERLEAVCITCHNLEHNSKGIIREGLAFDSQGNLVKTPVK